MVSVGLLVATVGVILLVVTASIWSRELRETGEDVRATVVDAEVVDSGAMNADHAVAVEYEYRYDGRPYEGLDVIHPNSLDEDGPGEPGVPSEYREGASVAVSVPPNHPESGELPDPGFQAMYRFLVPALAVTGALFLLAGGVLAL
ncbi:DUF3592 domain-containing protein [Halorubellus sp. PRR65]|uniref:DUF3592 domain-containing protein n=1 Tax=Halorubellus sp. PRR65 TaxID=3098148 RepID=UPI002B25FFE2|nr:DUF3592 domain-containing protein [Halorubellus sp. PRR65]